MMKRNNVTIGVYSVSIMAWPWLAAAAAAASIFS